MEQFNLNTIPGKVAPVCHASQYDTGRTIRVNLFEGDQVYTLDGTEIISVSVRKPDGHVVTEGITNTSAAYIEIVTTEQMTACPGANLCELKIEKGADVIGTLNFILSVEEDPLAGGDPSESFVYDLAAQIAEAVADQYDAADVIFDAAPTPGHGVGYAVTSEGVANAVQDAKDYTDAAIGGLSIPENITDLADTNINNPTNGEILVFNNGFWENRANPASTANFAPDYDDTATYNTNDKIIYQSLLYICLEDNVTGPWDSTKWQQISTADYNASNLPISPIDPTDTKKYIDNGLSGKVGAWTYNGQYTINGITTNVDWNLINAIPNGTKELLFGFCVGPNKRTMRYTVVVPYDVFGTYDTFLDYTIGALRVYCLLHKVDSSTINISQVNDGGGSDITVNTYYR